MLTKNKCNAVSWTEDTDSALFLLSQKKISHGQPEQSYLCQKNSVMDRGKTKTAVRQAILFHADRHLQKIVVLLYLQINEKIVLGPVKLLKGHIV